MPGNAVPSGGDSRGNFAQYRGADPRRDSHGDQKGPELGAFRVVSRTSLEHQTGWWWNRDSNWAPANQSSRTGLYLGKHYYHSNREQEGAVAIWNLRLGT